MRRLTLTLLGVLLACLLQAAAAGAVVVDMNAAGSSTSVPFNSSDQSGYYGLALLPGTGSSLSSNHIPVVTSDSSCADPWLSPDLRLPADGLCWHGVGSVMHTNETFALTWDPRRLFWEGTRNYVEQFLRDVADASGNLGTPYAVTTQYHDPTGRAGNSSVYGGGCIDYGQVGGYSCQFSNANGAGTGHDYPLQQNGQPDCAVTGTTTYSIQPDGSFGPMANEACITDADVRSELAAMIPEISGHTKPGATPLIMLLTPPNVEVCLDSGATVCSANSNSPVQFCSYHSSVDGVAYVVQPWTSHEPYYAPNGPSGPSCDDPSVPPLPATPTVQQLITDAGARLAGPLSQAQIASIVNPQLNGWFGLSGNEINDNEGCTPLGNNLDSVTVGSSGQNPYYLQREFNNAGVIESDPNALGCSLGVVLTPTFVAPSVVEPGDVIDFDGSGTASTLIVPSANYNWNFGDGTTGTGPSVQHSYTKPGTYTVTLTVTDRGGNTRTTSNSVVVAGPVPPGGGGGSGGSNGMKVHLQVIPQSLTAMLRRGLALRVTCNESADGIITLSIPAAAARRAHLKVGRSRSVVIARGTVSGIRKGTITLHIKVRRSTAAKLRRLRHLTLTVRLSVLGRGHVREAVDVAARF